MSVSALLLGYMIIGRSAPLIEATAKEQGAGAIYEELKVFTDVLAIVQKDYVSSVNPKKIIEGAIKGMLSSLDPHSGYLDPDFYKELQVQTRGEFGGLGIEITIRDGLLIVVSPMEGSPAQKVGIRGGDAIVKIEGKFTKDFTLVDAVKQLRGPKGSNVTLSIMREGREGLFDVVVTRDEISVKSIRSRYLGEGFAYARISQFVEKTTDDLKRALGGLRKQSDSGEIRGLVLDLRNNPGGLLTQAIGVSDLFLRDGLIVYTDGRMVEQKQKFFAHPTGTEPEYPIVVLVNGGSASAAEIVSGAIKDHGRGLILGTQTFGKGSVQTISPLKNGGALTLTTALYYTKSGQSLQLTGVSPDIEMDVPTETITVSEESEEEENLSSSMREADLPGAISNPNNRTKNKDKKKKKRSGNAVFEIDPEKEVLSVWLKKDPQLAKALELLKTFNIFRPEASKG